MCKVWHISKGGSSQVYYRKDGGRASQWRLKHEKIKRLWEKGIVDQGGRLHTISEGENKQTWNLKCKEVIVRDKAAGSWKTEGLVCHGQEYGPFL